MVYYSLTIISSFLRTAGAVEGHQQSWNPNPACQSCPMRVKGVISACFRCPKWKLACWHIFLLCLSEEARDYEATTVNVSHSGDTSEHRGIGLTGEG